MDFIIAAIDLHSLFKFPIKKRETLLSMIATLLKDQTSLYNSSYILYDVSSLVIILEDNKRSISKLRSFIDIVNNEVVAECVETPEEREILEQLNIDYLQGYLIHKPALF